MNDTPRREPSAPGGRFDVEDNLAGSPAETAWTRAALQSVLARGADAAASLAAVQAKAAEALLALDAGELGTLEDELLRGLHAAFFDGGGLQTWFDQLSELVDELYGVDPAFCRMCGGSLGNFQGQQEKGWQHWRELAVEVGTEVYVPEDGHEPVVGWTPRERPAIVEGRLGSAKPMSQN